VTKSLTASSRRRRVASVGSVPMPLWAPQDELFIPESQVALRSARRGIEGPTGTVEHLAQVVGGGLLSRVGPEEVDRLLSVHSMAGSQGKEFYQGGRLLRAPLLLPEGLGVHRNGEATEQPNAHRLRSLAC
jgi:hypothetical protein